MLFSHQELKERVRKLQNHLVDQKIDLAILNVNSDIYYYTGSVQPLYLLVPANNTPIVLGRKALDRIREEVTHIPLETFYGSKDLRNIIDKHNLQSAKRIGFTLDSTSYATVTRFLSMFQGAEAVDLSWDIRALRMIRSDTEIALQAKAGSVMADLPELIKSIFHPGMTELELSAGLENHFRLRSHGSMIRCRREGSEMLGFCVCTSGKNSLYGTKFDGICAGKGVSTATPIGASHDPIEKGVQVLLDFSFNLEGYMIDQTRMLCLGSPPDIVLRAYDAMLDVEKHIIKNLAPGSRCEDIYNSAVEYAASLGWADEFMGIGSEKVRFVGHGVGLELDEPPYLAPQMATELMSGMVVAVEPKVALQGIGIVGIENTYLIKDSGVELLTVCPQDFIIVD